MSDPPIAHLVCIRGPLGGRTIPISSARFIIGRESKSDLEVPDLSVSRPHCCIAANDGAWILTDEDSANGTYVNGRLLRAPHVLCEGDRIAIGNNEFLFRLSTSSTDEVEIRDSNVISNSTIRCRLDERTPEPSATSARDLNRLLRLAQSLNSARDLHSIERELLAAIFEITPAERGAVLVIEDSLDEIRAAIGLDRNMGRERRPISISRTIASRALREKTAVLISDIQASQEDSPSIQGSPVRALAAIPFVSGGRSTGILYAETTATFDDRHFQWLIAAAGIASLAVEKLSWIEKAEDAHRQLRSESRFAPKLIGDSPAMLSLYKVIARVARSDSTVLVLGETGTGKELVARQIHASSARSDKPFVAINCAILSENLLESELFGHERGAFTGASAQKLGKIEVARGGTLFLDEIGELALPLQAKLLRVLQEREFERIGGLRPIAADIRLVAATNRDLVREMEHGRFRQDLFYRLKVVSLTLPPLRERADDISLLANFFAARQAERLGRRILGISPEALAALRRYSWPGNLRELENVIERAAVLGSEEWIGLDDLPEEILQLGTAVEAPAPMYHDAIRAAKRQTILQCFTQTGGSYTETAALLGIHPNNLHRLIRNLNLKSELERFT